MNLPTAGGTEKEPVSAEALERFLLRYARSGLVLVSPDNTIVSANDEACSLLGLSLEELESVGVEELALSFVRPDGSAMPRTETPLWQARATLQTVRGVVLGIDRPNGTRAWILGNAFPEIDDKGSLRHVVITLVDLTSHMQAEVRLNHLTEVLRAIRNVNQLIVRERDRDVLTRRACEILTETRGYHSAWIGLRDSTGRLRPIAQSGIDPTHWTSFVAQSEGKLLPVRCIQALAEPRVTIRDTPKECPVCPLSTDRGHASAIAGTLRSSGYDHGLLVVSLSAELADDPDEQSLFDEMVSDIALALHAIKLDEERRQAEATLRRSEALYHALFDNMMSGLAYSRLVFDGERPVDLIYLAVNSAFEKITGLHDVVGKRLSELIPGVHEEEPELLQFHAKVVRSGTPDRVETYVKAWQLWLEILSYSLGGDDFVTVFAVITERKQAEAELYRRLQLQDQLERVSATVPGAIFTFELCPDGSMRLLFATPQFEEFWGISPDDLREDFAPAFARIHPGDQDSVRTTIEVSAKTMQPWRSTFRVMHPDRGEVWLEGHSMPRRGEDGAISWHGFVQDVTEQKRAEQALRESEERFRTLVENAPVAIFVRVDDRFAYLNPAAVHLFGAGTAEDLLGRSVLERFHLDSREPARARMRDMEESGEPTVSADRTLLRLDGTPVPVIISAVPVVYQEAAGALVFAQDFSEQRRALDDLRESEERFRALADGAPDGIFIQSDGIFLYVNTAMTKLLGAGTPQELVGTELLSRIAPEYHNKVRRRIRLQQETGAAVPPMEQEMLRLDGSRVPIETSAVAFRFQGRSAHLVFVRDHTERRKAEQERAYLEEQLLQAQKMESIGRLAGGVAHDFNNILMVQKGYCELLRLNTTEGDSMSEGLRQIEQHADRASDLTRQLLAFSRRQTLQPTVFDMNVLVSNMAQMLLRLIREDVELLTVVAPQPAKIQADRGQVEQLLINLAVNARDAMPGGGRLTVRVARKQLDGPLDQHRLDMQPGPYVVLTVSDTGHGMDAETKRRIFEPFFTTKPEGQGTGLGLSTAYGIARQSGGDIFVCSEPGKGATFEVYLPEVEAEPTPSKERKAEVAMGNSELILIVEDEAALRTLAVLMLEKLGYRTIQAANGQEAISLVEKEGLRPRLILTDVVMPGLSGRALIGRLRQSHPQVKVIFMSGYTDDSVADHGVIDADTAFLQKPFSMGDLAALVRSTLSVDTTHNDDMRTT